MVDIWFNIPDRIGWQARRLKRLVTLQTNKVDRAESDRPYIGLEHVESGYGRLLPVAETAENEEENSIEGTANAFEPGDVLFGKLRPYLAKAYRAEAAGCCSPELLVLTPGPELDGRFLLYTILTPNFISLVNSTAFGAKMPRADWNAIGNIFIPLPTLKQQETIADFLDHELQRLDQLAAARQQQLALLEEKRRALIAQAVTQGLDAQAPRRDSSFVWLGQVPAHWDVVRLKFLAKERLSYGANEAADEEDYEHPRFVRITDIDENGDLRPETFRSLPLEVAEPYLLSEGDILFARSGATVGKTFIYRKSWGVACFAGYLIRMKCDIDKVLPDFLYYFAQSPAYWAQIEEGAIQATIPNFSAEKYADIVVPLPSLNEQLGIVRKLKLSLIEINNLREVIEQSIDLLQQKRASLITTAVTGQLTIT